MRSGLAFEATGKVMAMGDGTKDRRSVTYSPFGAMAQLHMEGLSSVEDDLSLLSSQSGAHTGQGVFHYQNINTAILGRLLTEVYDQPLERVLADLIWKPAGAGDADWRRSRARGAVSAYCCLYATVEDWLRIGRYVLSNGTLERPLLSESTWRRFLGMGLSVQQRNAGVYGDQVRHDILNRLGEPLQGYFSYFLGNGGQTLYLVPSEDLVVVRFGRALPLLHSTLYAAWRDIQN